MTTKPGNRILKLKGAYNFRDLGGYAASEGKTTRWSRLYRSDNLARLTRGDLKKIEALNIRSVVDLRSKQEVLSKPNRLPGSRSIRVSNLEISDYADGYKALKQQILSGRSGQIDVKAMMFKAYRQGVIDYRHQLKRFFELLLDPDTYPAIVLCNAGKDRTGVASALALMALGVSRDTVMKDYLLSSDCLAPMVSRMAAQVRLRSLFRANVDQLKILLETRAQYLETTFETLDRQYGSTEAYLDALGIDSDKRRC